MSIIDNALKANRKYAQRHDPRLGQRPAPKIAVVTCMDPRLSNLPEILGLPHADIDVIRTGGPAVTDDVLGELVVSTRVLGTTQIMLLNHTGCGFTTFTDDELNSPTRPGGFAPRARGPTDTLCHARCTGGQYPDPLSCRYLAIQGPRRQLARGYAPGPVDSKWLSHELTEYDTFRSLRP
jgi:hypothetical protein